MLEFSRLRQRGMLLLTWLLFHLRSEVVCPDFIARDTRSQKVILFVCIAAEKFTGRVHSSSFVVFCQHLWAPSCAHFPILQLVCQNPINDSSRNLSNRNIEIIQRDPPIFVHGFLNLRSRLFASWLSSASFFVMNFSATKCKLPTPLSDAFVNYAWLAIHFCQLMINFNRCIAFCIQKPNNCMNFALSAGTPFQKVAKTKG